VSEDWVENTSGEKYDGLDYSQVRRISRDVNVKNNPFVKVSPTV